MARSLGGTLNVGTAGVSALLRSAASAATQLADLQDKEQALSWTTSDQGDQAYSGYSKYLNDRIAKLQATNTITNQSRAATLAKTLVEATRSYHSSLILQASIGVQEGNYTDAEKAVLLRNLANQAYASGDQQNGLHLEDQYNSLVLKIQNQAQTAAAQAQNDNYQQYSATVKAFNQLADALRYQMESGQISSGKYYTALNQTLQTKEAFLREASQSDLLSPEHQAAAQTELDNLKGKADQAAYFARQIAQGIPADSLAMKDGTLVSQPLKQGMDYVIGANGMPVYKPVLHEGNLTTKYDSASGQYVPVPASTGTAGTAADLTTLERTHGDSQYYTHHLVIDQATGQLSYFRDLPGENTPGSQVEVTPQGQRYNTYLLDSKGKPVIGPDGKPIRNLSPDNTYKATFMNEAGAALQDIGARTGSLIKPMLDFVTAHHTLNNLPTLAAPVQAVLQFLHATGANQFKLAQEKAAQAASQRALEDRGALGQVRQVAAQPLSQPLPANMGVAARNLANPAAAGPVRPASPVFTNPSNQGQRDVNTIGAINQAIGGMPSLPGL